MAVRIPATVNRAWDALERRPMVTLLAGLSVVSLVVFPLVPVWPAAAAVFLSGVGLTASVYRVIVTQLEDERDDALSEAAHWRHQVRRVQAGEASAATTELRPIGGLGERS